MEASNTGEIRKPGTFSKGDPRINRKGRPKSFDALRALAQQIAHEVAEAKDGLPLIISGHKVSIAEMILRNWAHSKTGELEKAFIEIAFGKVPDKLDTNVSGVLVIRYVNDWRNPTAETPPGAAGSNQAG